MPISQFFILTPRGDTIVSKDYRGDVVRGTSDIFFRKLKSWGADPPPIFNMEGTHFVHIKRNNLYFVCTTKFNISPAMVLELLTRVANIIKDYTGVLSEESIRVNFVLIYELLDEVIDFGYGQITSTDSLKAQIYKEAVAVEQPDRPRLKIGGLDKKKRSVPSNAANVPISLRHQKSNRNGKNEIFLDLLEKLTVLFNSSGGIIRSEIHGAIHMKSFLYGMPEVSIGLNEDLRVGQGSGGYGLTFDDCNFHECVDLAAFESSSTLSLRPPDGEFTVMNYRISGQGFHNPLPFVVEVAYEDTVTPGRTDVLVKLEAKYPQKTSGSSISVKIPLPKATTSCGHELGRSGQSLQFKKDEKVAYWSIPKLSGASTSYLRLRVCTSAEDQHTIRKEVGPISLEFEIPMYLCSEMAIRFLSVTERGRKYTPFRWVRYITHSDSYVVRT